MRICSFNISKIVCPVELVVIGRIVRSFETGLRKSESSRYVTHIAIQLEPKTSVLSSMLKLKGVFRIWSNIFALIWDDILFDASVIDFRDELQPIKELVSYFNMSFLRKAINGLIKEKVSRFSSKNLVKSNVASILEKGLRVGRISCLADSFLSSFVLVSSLWSLCFEVQFSSKSLLYSAKAFCEISRSHDSQNF